MKAIIAKIVAWFSGDTVQKVLRCIPAVVSDVEAQYKAAIADGRITPDERKSMAIALVAAIAKESGLKLNPIMQWVISTIIDNAAKKLPPKDISIPDFMVKISGSF